METIKKQIVDYFIDNGVLITEGLLDKLSSKGMGYVSEFVKSVSDGDIKSMLVLSESVEGQIGIGNVEVNWNELEKRNTLLEKGGAGTNAVMGYQPEQGGTDAGTGGVRVLESHPMRSKKWSVQDFVFFFNKRYKTLEGFLRNRQELINTTSIARVLSKKDRETVSLIGAVSNVQYTKNNNIMLTVEDPTGSMRVLVNKNKPEIFDKARAIVPDEVLGIVGVNSEKIVFVNNIVWPDVPHREMKKSPDEGYAAFISDLHVGSNNFLRDEFDKFLKWLNCKAGNDKQKEIASKVKYIFIVGDLVEGCGVYPGQEEELVIKDIYRQYIGCAKLLAEIPKTIKIIICPGNHDAVRISDPQPQLDNKFAKPICDLPNVIMVSSPAQVNIHSSEDFSGFDVLLYHGYSFDYYINNVDVLRSAGGYKRADLVMKFLLQRRHLAPTHTSTLYAPISEKDPLIISCLPDFFVTGHIHYSVVANYKNISMVSGSCWQSKTSFQEKMGHEPQPCRVPIVNLQTREMKVLKFGG